ncbi:MAG: lycopene cyclase family protein [Polyangiales bacterium]
MADSFDIVVLGSGPAALVIADSCGALGASVALLAPAPEVPWKPNYCLWAEELPARFESVVERRWEGVVVRSALGEHTLDRPYVKLSTPALQGRLWSHLRNHGIQVIDGRATGVVPDDDGVRVEASGHDSLHARVVVDATGATSPFVRRIHTGAPAFQTAFGLLLDAPNHAFDRRHAVLMDFRPADPTDAEPSSFFYVLPLDNDRLFVEETSLALRPAMDLEVLRQRLERRMATRGLSSCARLEEEHCHIAMGLALPEPHQRVLPFGAAASMVHPASGYLQAHVFRKAPKVAAAIVEGLREGDGRHATQRGHQALWPHSERAVWELYGVGLEALVRMNADQTARFFDAFFSTPASTWAAYLGGTLAMPEFRGVMTELFRSLPVRLQWRLVRTSVTGGAAPLARSLMPAGMTPNETGHEEERR